MFCSAAQAEIKSVLPEAKSWTDIPGVPPPVRLVVNSTSNSQISSNPILGPEAVPGIVLSCCHYVTYPCLSLLQCKCHAPTQTSQQLSCLLATLTRSLLATLYSLEMSSYHRSCCQLSCKLRKVSQWVLLSGASLSKLCCGAAPRRRPTVDHFKGAVLPPNEAERMEAFNAIGLGNAPHDPTTARLCHVLSKLLQVSIPVHAFVSHRTSWSPGWPASYCIGNSAHRFAVRLAQISAHQSMRPECRLTHICSSSRSV